MKFKDKRRKHHHWKVTVTYVDGGEFARVYIDLEKAEGFAARQRKSLVVKTVQITEVDQL